MLWKIGVEKEGFDSVDKVNILWLYIVWEYSIDTVFSSVMLVW